ncbi:MAG TPA: prephenate dehydrogenase/arogenate dehydrogenase family protein [Longilinea sp.]|nr:prephenate dehydrogenase/arogenate dehydrogenase family protein [Longilinea sp.]
MTINFTILGLGQVGASLGLALKEHKDKIYRTGSDREPITAQRAQKMGAVDHIAYNLSSAVEKADVVVLALPVDQIRETLEFIGPVCRPGTVIIDTSPMKSAVAAWAQELLPEERYLISMTPTINPEYLEEAATGIDAVHADLFNKSLMVISNEPSTHPDAVKLAADIAHLAGARVYFAEAAEMDGLLAANDLLPKLASVGLLSAIANQPSWREGQRLAGRSFAQATMPAQLLDGSATLGKITLANRDNTLRVLTDLIGSLQLIREYVTNQDSEGLNDMAQRALEARKDWYSHRMAANWDESEVQKMPTIGEVLGRLVGVKPRDRRS